MRSYFFGTKELVALLLGVPSARSFTVLPVTQHRVGVVSESSSFSRSSSSRRRIKNELLSDLDTQDEASATTTTTSMDFDPSEAFKGESAFSDLMLGLLKEAHYKAAEDPVSLEEEEQDSKDKSSVGDIIRDLNGKALSKEYFAEKMGLANVESYTCPEQDAFRGFMSNACRVHLLPGGETAFYKHIVFETLDHAQEKLRTAPHKLIRDSKSYQVVASFLLSRACKRMTEQTGVQIPKCYDAKLEPNHENPMESKFSFLFEDFAPADGWYQQWLLQDQESCQAALSTFAKIHAFFWSGSDFWKDTEAAQELEEGVWKCGSYVQPKAQNVNQCKQVASEWAKKRMRFETELSSFDYWDNLGERLESVAEECGRLAHPFADDALSEQYNKYRTFTHGDPKQANLLFRRSTTGSDESLKLGLIDFQWSGFGLASSDIAHFLTSGVHADMLVDGGEEKLQRYYFDELQKYLVEFGAYSTADDAIRNFSYDTFMDQYDIAVLDICRLMIAYTWSRFEEPVEKDDKAACARTMNKTSYNKSIPNIIWLLSRCDEILKSRMLK